MGSLYFEHLDKFIILLKQFIDFLLSLQATIVLPREICWFVWNKRHDFKKLLAIVLDQGFRELMDWRSQ